MSYWSEEVNDELKAELAFLSELSTSTKTYNFKENLQVSDTIAMLNNFFFIHHSLMTALSGWIIRIAEFEIKMTLSYHIYLHAMAAKSIFERLNELGQNDESICRKCHKLQFVFNEVKASESTLGFLVAIYSIIIPALLTEYQTYLTLTSEILDKPSVYRIKHIMVDVGDMQQFAHETIGIYKKHGKYSDDIITWGNHIQSIVTALGGIGLKNGSEENLPLLHTQKPFARPFQCERDARFKTFAHTRDYAKADEYSTLIENDIEKRLFEMIRTQRDEIDAVETFANVLHDFKEAPFQLQCDLARFIWDEARHAMIGQQLLADMGYNPFDIPCGLIGINVRTELEPKLAFAQINIFGESNIVSKIRSISKEARESGYNGIATALDYIYSDEIVHIRKGRKWLREIVAPKTMEDMKKEARTASIEFLKSQGIYNEKYDLGITDKELGELIGE